MKLRLLDFLACPGCRGEGGFTCHGAQSDQEVNSGELECLSCQAKYPIREGIPRFVSESNYADSFGFQWNLFEQTQRDEYWGADISGERFRRETGWPADLRGELVLEAGCGMGRFTPYAAASGAEVVSIDYSSAVDACKRNNGRLPNVHFIQADIYHLPLKHDLFHKAYCFGVLQHCPDPRQAYLSLVPFVKSGGRLVVDVYRFSWHTLFYGYYYIRLLTKGRNPKRLFPWVRRYFDFAYALTGFLRRLNVNVAGKVSMLLGIADYRGRFNIDEDRMRELCLLDTFDKLSPAHDHPQTIGTIRGWLEDAGLVDIAVHPGYNGVEAHGRKG